MEKAVFVLLALTDEEAQLLKVQLDEQGRCTVPLTKENITWVSAADFILARLSDSSQKASLLDLGNEVDAGHILNNYSAADGALAGDFAALDEEGGSGDSDTDITLR